MPQTNNESEAKIPAKRRKSPRRRWKRALLLLVLMTLLILRVERNVTDVVLTLSQATARSLAIQALNEAASEMLGLGVHYADLMTVEKDAQGQVRLIQANTPEMNCLAAPGVPACAGKIDRHGAENRRRAAGQCHRADAAGGRRAGIAVQILPVGSVQAAFSTDFTTAGINQTRHRISLVLTANVQIVIPTGAKNVQASTQMAMAESIIVGQVPDSFAEGGSDNSIIDLAP